MPSPALQRLSALPASPLSSGAPTSPQGKPSSLGTSPPVASTNFDTLDAKAASAALSRVPTTDEGHAVREAFSERPSMPRSAYTGTSSSSLSLTFVALDVHEESKWEPPASVKLQYTLSDVLAASRQAGSISTRRKKDDETLSPVEQGKRAAAYAAVDRHVKPEHKVIGIGSGSTVPYVVERIKQRGAEENEDRWFVPTGFQSKELIVKAGFSLGDVDQFAEIDVTLDGADDVDIHLNAIKGGGACHLREKVLAEAANEWIIVADSRKDSKILGDAWHSGVPIEVPPFAWSKVLANIPGSVNPTLRMAKAKAGPVVSDNGNFIIDCGFDEAHMLEPETLLLKLKLLTGIVEIGLFVGMATAVYFGNIDNAEVKCRRADGSEEILPPPAEVTDQPARVDSPVDL